MLLYDLLRAVGDPVCSNGTAAVVVDAAASIFGINSKKQKNNFSKNPPRQQIQAKEV